MDRERAGSRPLVARAVERSRSVDDVAELHGRALLAGRQRSFVRRERSLEPVARALHRERELSPAGDALDAHHDRRGLDGRAVRRRQRRMNHRQITHLNTDARNPHDERWARLWGRDPGRRCRAGRRRVRGEPGRASSVALDVFAARAWIVAISPEAHRSRAPLVRRRKRDSGRRTGHAWRGALTRNLGSLVHGPRVLEGRAGRGRAHGPDDHRPCADEDAREDERHERARDAPPTRLGAPAHRASANRLSPR